MCIFKNVLNCFHKKKRDNIEMENVIEIDYDSIVNTLESWEDVGVFKEFCNMNHITQNRDDVKLDDENYILKVIASDLLYKLNITINHYHIVRINKIKD